MRRDVFQAIADPTRREILKLISKEPLNVNSVAEKFDISRAAIYKHVKILTQCGLIAMRQQGRERFCEQRLEKLKAVTEWVDEQSHAWNDKLDLIEDYRTGLEPKKTGVRF